MLLGWALLYAKRDGDWRPLEQYPSESTCLRVRSVSVANEVRGEIGSALADQPADNPIRQQAAARVERRVGERYRCEWQRAD